MKFLETQLDGPVIIEVEAHQDERGLFARTFCANEFKAHGLPEAFVQGNTSFNAKKGTLRGMHYQSEPSRESKLVRCTAGALLDVIVDLRPDSSTFLQHFGVELTSDNRKALFVPVGFAHGFCVISETAEICYQCSAEYAPESESGIIWNDPSINIDWPITSPIITDQDKAMGSLDESDNNFTYDK